MQFAHVGFVVVLIVAGVTPGVAVADRTDASSAAALDTGTGQAGSNVHVINETATVHPRLEERGTAAVSFEYDLPVSVTGLTVRLRALENESVTVASTDGFERRNETDFEWDGSTETPTLRVRYSVPETRIGDRWAVEREGWALLSRPGTYVAWRYNPRLTEREVTLERHTTVAGEGMAIGDLVYAGPGETYSRETIAGERIHVRVVPGADPGIDPRRTAEIVAGAVSDLRTGFQHESVGVYVLPAAATPPDFDGRNTNRHVWVEDAAVEPDGTRSTLIHEAVHARIGVFEGERAEWLTEAVAEYYEHLLALNQGLGDFESFRESVRTRKFTPDGEPVVLTDPESWADTEADYRKGAQVLAALDAEIRNRTDGERTLRDVFAVRFGAGEQYDDLNTYAGFRAAVVDVAGDESLGDWLDRYATTERLPSVPDDPTLYVTNGRSDTDEDGLTDAEEQAADTDPFGADTDGDGVPDPAEVDGPTDPSARDTDGDGLADGTERDGATDPANPDTDGDGTPDGEDAFPTDPQRATETAGDATTETEGPGFGVLPALGALVCLLVGRWIGLTPE